MGDPRRGGRGYHAARGARACAAPATAGCARLVPRILNVPHARATAGAAPLRGGEGLLSLQRFAVARVLLHGAPLLSCDAARFDPPPASSAAGGAAGRGERLAAARAALRARLGLDGPLGAALGGDGDAFIRDADLEEEAVVAAVPKAPQQDAGALVSSMGGTGGDAAVAPALSARETARAKRKAKEAARLGGGKRARGPLTPEEAAADAAAEAAEAEEEAAAAALGAWGAASTLDEVLLSLFEPRWEARHGAALAVRSILAAPAAATALPQPVVVDAALRLLCVLCLDRFTDFAGDAAVAPVRETAAQALALAVRSLDNPAADAIVGSLFALTAKSLPWQARAGGWAGLKYIFASRPAAAAAAASAAVASGLEALRPSGACGDASSAEDEVRAAAAAALAPILPSLDGSQRASLETVLWDGLGGFEPLSPAAPPCLRLIARLAAPRFPPASSLSPPPPPATAVPASRFALLWPFARHPVGDARLAAATALKCLLPPLLLASAPPPGAACSDHVELLSTALRIALQGVCLDADASVTAEWEAAFVAALRSAPPALASAALAPHCAALLELVSCPDGGAPHASFLVAFASASPASAAAPHAAASAHRSPQASTGASRAAAAELVGAWARAAHPVPPSSRDDRPASAPPPSTAALAACLVSALSAEAAPGVRMSRRAAAAAVAAAWAAGGCDGGGSSASSPHDLSIRSPLPDVLFSALEAAGEGGAAEPPPPYEETASLRVALRSALAPLLHRAASPPSAASSPAARALRELPPPQAGMSAAAGEAALAEVASAVGAAAAAPARASLAALQAADAAAACRVNGAVACARVAVFHASAAAAAESENGHGTSQPPLPSRPLPAKLNSLLQPLMAAVRRERCCACQAACGVALSRLALLASQRTPSPSDKVVANLGAMAVADLHEPNGGASDDEDEAGAPSASPHAAAAAPRGPKPPAPDVAAALAAAASAAGGQGGALSNAGVARRGASTALRLLAASSPSPLDAALWRLVEPVAADAAGGGGATAAAPAQPSPSPSLQPSRRAAAARLLAAIAPSLPPTGDPRAALLRQLPHLASLLRSASEHRDRSAAAAALASIACSPGDDALAAAASTVSLLLGSGEGGARAGGASAARALAAALPPHRLAPVAALLLVPLMGGMADASAAVRGACASAFARLLPLLPLALRPPGISGEAQPPPAPSLPPELAARAVGDAEALRCLVDGAAVAEHSVPLPLALPLRRYQQEGVNWMAFLRRMGLSGALCDDMGACAVGPTISKRNPFFFVWY